MVAAYLSYELLVHEYTIRLTLLMEGAVQDAQLNAVQAKIEEACRRPKCEVGPAQPCRHLGGNQTHNLCAEWVPYPDHNRFPGCDALVVTPSGRRKNYDALSASSNTLWEVKTDNYTNNPDFVKRITILKHISEIESERSIAYECALDYYFVVSDVNHRADLITARPDLSGIIKFEPCLSIPPPWQ